MNQKQTAIEGFSAAHPNILKIEPTYLQSAKMVDGIECHEKLRWSLVHCGMFAGAEVERECRFRPRTKVQNDSQGLGDIECGTSGALM